MKKIFSYQSLVLRSIKLQSLLFLFCSTSLIFFVAFKFFETYWLQHVLLREILIISVGFTALNTLFYPFLMMVRNDFKIPKDFNILYRYGGGIKGYFKGTQRLRDAFLFINLGSLVTLIIFESIFLDFVIDIDIRLFDFIFWSMTYILTTLRSIISWITIFKCRKNTSFKIFTYLALLYIVIDFLHRAWVIEEMYNMLPALYKNIL